MAGTTNSGPQASNLMTQVGGSALGSLIGTGMGLLFNETNDTNQNNEQNRLDQIQYNWTEAEQNQNMARQMQMWEQTNYPAQVAQMEKAGLNPALMYSGRGAGGATTGTPGPANIASAQALPNAANGMAVATMQQMGIQADIDLKNAEADRIRSMTPKDIENTQASTGNINQDTKNKQAQQVLTQLQSTGQGLQNQLTDATMPDAIAKAHATASEAATTAAQAVQKQWITQETMNSQISAINASAIKALLDNKQVQANIAQTGAQTTNIRAALEGIIRNNSTITMNAVSQQAQADAASRNAATNEGWLTLEKELKDMPDSMKTITEAITKLIPSFHFGAHTTTLQ